MVFTPASRAALDARDKTWPRKAFLRLAILVLDVVGIILFAVAGSRASAYQDVDDAVKFWGFIPLAISFIWTLLVLLLLAILSPRLPSTRGRHATIHPGLAVGVELILTIGLVLSALLMTTIAAYDYLDLGYDPASTSTSTSEVTASALQTSILALAACAILCITALLHFTLFVLACIDTDTHRRARRRADDDVNAQLIARRIVDEMAERGEIIRAPLLVGAEEGGWTGERDGGGVTGAEAGAGAGRAEEALMGRPLVNTTHHRERGDERETAPFLAAEHEGGEIGRAL